MKTAYTRAIDILTRDEETGIETHGYAIGNADKMEPVDACEFTAFMAAHWPMNVESFTTTRHTFNGDSYLTRRVVWERA